MEEFIDRKIFFEGIKKVSSELPLELVVNYNQINLVVERLKKDAKILGELGSQKELGTAIKDVVAFLEYLSKVLHKTRKKIVKNLDGEECIEQPRFKLIEIADDSDTSITEEELIKIIDILENKKEKDLAQKLAI